MTLKKKNGDSGVHSEYVVFKFPKWAIGLIVSSIVGSVGTIITISIFVFVVKTTLVDHENKLNYQERFNEAVKISEWKNHQKNILDCLPKKDDIQGGSNGQITLNSK